MYASKPGLIIGFHGCDKSTRDKIVNGKLQLKPSKNDYDWLGNGMYFWESNQARALAFAEELLKRPGSKNVINAPSVLGAVIDLGFCLDLLDSEYIDLVSQSYATLEESFKTMEIEMPVNRKLSGSADLLLRNLDCAVIENLHMQRVANKLKQFDSSKGMFVEGDPLYSGAGFHEKNHIQICIRNPNCIKGFFIPRTADNKYDVP